MFTKIHFFIHYNEKTVLIYIKMRNYPSIFLSQKSRMKDFSLSLHVEFHFDGKRA